MVTREPRVELGRGILERSCSRVCIDTGAVCSCTDEYEFPRATVFPGVPERHRTAEAGAHEVDAVGAGIPKHCVDVRGEPVDVDGSKVRARGATLGGDNRLERARDRRLLPRPAPWADAGVGEERDRVAVTGRFVPDRYALAGYRWHTRDILPSVKPSRVLHREPQRYLHGRRTGGMDPATLRAEIPALSNGTVYLNTGASGPSPERVLTAAHDAQRAHEVTGHRGNPYEYAWDAYDASREAVAGLLDVEPSTVALTHSTADGISRVVNAVSWSSGDVVVRTDLEHPAGILPFQRLERDGVEVRVTPAPAGQLDRDAYTEAVSDADLVCLSSLSWLHGTRLPVRDAVEIAHDAGAFVVVDAVQSVGGHAVRPADWGADAVAAAGHKWLLGVWGAGFLRVAPDIVDDLAPRHVGYRSVDSDASGFAYEPGAARFEVGTASLAPHAALTEAIEVREELGVDTVVNHIELLARRLADGLGDRLASPTPPESGLVAFEDPTPEATVARLADEGIHVRTVGKDQVRASIHVFNTAEDVDTLLAALA